MFIEKPGEKNYTKVLAYCPISLSFFLLKTKDNKFVGRNIKGNILRNNQLHINQFAHQAGNMH
jgi:hypothetical protein